MANINLKELKELIDLISEKGFAEFEVERQGFRLRIVRFKEPTPDLSPAPVPPVSTPSPVKASSEGSQVRQTATSPEATPVAPAEPVEPETVLHIIKS